MVLKSSSGMSIVGRGVVSPSYGPVLRLLQQGVTRLYRHFIRRIIVLLIYIRGRRSPLQKVMLGTLSEYGFRELYDGL